MRSLAAFGLVLLAACAGQTAQSPLPGIPQACQAEVERLAPLLEQARQCRQDADCQVASGRCPHDCWLALNREYAPQVERAMQQRDTACTCEYSCLRLDAQPRCVSGRCELIWNR